MRVKVTLIHGSWAPTFVRIAARGTTGLLLLLCACQGSTEPAGFTLPPPDLSLDPAAIREPRLLYLCKSFVDSVVVNRQLRPIPPPNDTNILADVSFGRTGPELPMDRMLDSQRQAIARFGGRIVYSFHFPAARVWIPTRNIPGFFAATQAVIYWVRDPRRYDWPVGVGYRAPYSYTQGAARFQKLGGRVDGLWNVINALGGVLPDRSVPALRADRNVEYVEGTGQIVFCNG